METNESQLRIRFRETLRKVLSSESPGEEIKLKIYKNSPDKIFIDETLNSVLKQLEDEFFKNIDEKN